jgi:cytochrome c biogenesis protein CcdA
MVVPVHLVEVPMTSNRPPSVPSWVLFALASLAIVHALGESFGPLGMVAGVAAMVVAAVWLRYQADPALSLSGRSFLERMEREKRKRTRRKPPPDDADGSAPVTSPLRPRPVLTGGEAKAIPSELP